MSMIVTTVVPEGIVMAADSAVSTFKMIDMENLIKGNVPAAMANMANGTCAHKEANIVGSITLTRSARKLHVMKGNNIAIADGNQRNAGGVSIAPYIEHFCSSNQFDDPKSCAAELLNLIKGLGANINAVYHVCGYNMADKIPRPEFFYVDVEQNTVTDGLGSAKYGINLGAANEYFIPYALKINKNIVSYSLQDAVDVTVFAIDMSMKLERFIDHKELISPPIDLLVIKPDGVEWIQQKTLKVEG